MKALAVLAFVLLAAGPTYAQPDADGPPPIFRQIREAFDAGDYAEAKRLLLQAYELTPDPKFLFALAQAELNLGNYGAAIDYYEKFIATNPAPEQAALAQQGIGAARIRMKEKPPEDKPPPIIENKPPPPPPPAPEGTRWTLTHTGLVAFGGAAVLLGGGLLLYSRSLGNDRSGTLSAYDARVDQARTTRWTGVGIAAAGTLLIGVTLLW